MFSTSVLASVLLTPFNHKPTPDHTVAQLGLGYVPVNLGMFSTSVPTSVLLKVTPFNHKPTPDHTVAQLGLGYVPVNLGMFSTSVPTSV